MDKALKFFVEEIEGIRALLELKDYAESRLPQEIIKMLFNELRGDYKKWKWGPSEDERSLGCYRSATGVQWYDTNWLDPKDDDCGLYFGISNLTASSLIEHDDDDRPDLYIYHDARVGNLTAKILKQAFALANKDLHKKIPGIHINEEEKDGVTLAWLSLGEMISIEQLQQNREGMLQEFLAKSREFTEAIAPIAYDVSRG